MRVDTRFDKGAWWNLRLVPGIRIWNGLDVCGELMIEFSWLRWSFDISLYKTS